MPPPPPSLSARSLAHRPARSCPRYSRRALLAAASTSIASAASSSVSAFARLAGLALQTTIDLRAELHAEIASRGASSGCTSLSAGGLASSLAKALLQEAAALEASYADAAQSIAALATDACAGLTTQLKPEIAALETALEGTRSGFGIDGGEVRALMLDAARFLLPLASLLAPSVREPAAAAAAATQSGEPTVEGQMGAVSLS